MLIDRVWLVPAMFEDVARLTGKDCRTVRRWYAAGELPVVVSTLLDVIYNGNLAPIHPDYDGWSIDTATGQLWSPEGVGFGLGEIRSMPLRHHLIAALRCEIRELRAHLGTSCRRCPPDRTRPLIHFSL